MREPLDPGNSATGPLAKRRNRLAEVFTNETRSHKNCVAIQRDWPTIDGFSESSDVRGHELEPDDVATETIESVSTSPGEDQLTTKLPSSAGLRLENHSASCEGH